ncbi:MAG: hypothetical protein P8189_28145 [Anaerolineae bacterium]|jgi:hypothetical protein
MGEPKGEIIVGVLGQYASGKSEAARSLIRYLGGKDEAIFINDRELLTRLAVDHLLELDEAQVTSTMEEDGTQRLDGKLATIWLRRGEDLNTLDLDTLRWEVRESVVHPWLARMRVNLGHKIRAKSAEGKPVVIEAGFGENPLSQTLSHLFASLEKAGVGPEWVKWILVEAGFEKRAERNAKRRGKLLDDVFAAVAADGGDLDPDHQSRLEERGLLLKRVPNEHDDIHRFRADIIAAFEEMF